MSNVGAVYIFRIGSPTSISPLTYHAAVFPPLPMVSSTFFGCSVCPCQVYALFLFLLSLRVLHYLQLSISEDGLVMSVGAYRKCCGKGL
jgi:hypothetical protein